MSKSEPKGYKIIDQYATYFLTFTIVGWVDLFTRKYCKDIIIQSVKYCQEKKGLVLNAYVIIPSHIHLIARAEERSKGLSSIIRDFKSHTLCELKKFILHSKAEKTGWKWFSPIMQNTIQIIKNGRSGNRIIDLRSFYLRNSPCRRFNIFIITQ